MNKATGNLQISGFESQCDTLPVVKTGMSNIVELTSFSITVPSSYTNGEADRSTICHVSESSVSSIRYNESQNMIYKYEKVQVNATRPDSSINGDYLNDITNNSTLRSKIIGSKLINFQNDNPDGTCPIPVEQTSDAIISFCGYTTYNPCIVVSGVVAENYIVTSYESAILYRLRTNVSRYTFYPGYDKTSHRYDKVYYPVQSYNYISPEAYDSDPVILNL